MSDSSEPPRYLPDVPLPPYSYVPGRFPHPTSDPRGHSFGEAPGEIQPPNAERWRECTPYLRGIDLFNHGYYWEAHETWEQLWLAAKRTGPIATFVQGLIKLAAAGVKAREGRPNGVRRHLGRSVELLKEATASGPTFMGLDTRALIQRIETAEDRAVVQGAIDPDAAVRVVFDFVLRPL